MTIYTKPIMELLKVDQPTAMKVEALMRITYRTLDGLSRARFNREAKACLRELR